jgi:hypothetical protein
MKTRKMTVNRSNSNLNPCFKIPEYKEIRIILIIVAMAPSIRRICPNLSFSSPSDFNMGTMILNATVGNSRAKNMMSIFKNCCMTQAKESERSKEPKYIISASNSELVNKSTIFTFLLGSVLIIFIMSISNPARKIRNKNPVLAKKSMYGSSGIKSNTNGPMITPIMISTITDGTLVTSIQESNSGTIQAIMNMKNNGQ